MSIIVFCALDFNLFCLCFRKLESEQEDGKHFLVMNVDRKIDLRKMAIKLKS